MPDWLRRASQMGVSIFVAVTLTFVGCAFSRGHFRLARWKLEGRVWAQGPAQSFPGTSYIFPATSRQNRGGARCQFELLFSPPTNRPTNHASFRRYYHAAFGIAAERRRPPLRVTGTPRRVFFGAYNVTSTVDDMGCTEEKRNI